MEINIEKSLIGTLGIEMKEISDGKVVATMPVDERTKLTAWFIAWRSICSPCGNSRKRWWNTAC